MPRYRLTIEYHGGPFAGWQRQDGQPSVQASLERALSALDTAPDNAAIVVQGAGRTDAGVHATGQVAHVDLARVWDPHRLLPAVNHHLAPDPVAVVAVCPVEQAFHARFSATARHYEYVILNRRAPLTLEAGLAWRVARPLDAEAMAAAAALMLGRHDFTTFRASQCQASSPVKTLDRFDVMRMGDRITARLSSRSFLHNQVRSLIGSLEKVGSGAWKPEDMRAALEARDRTVCGPVAPAHGLYLTGVDYADAAALPAIGGDTGADGARRGALTRPDGRS
ncbi:MAG: tRNA pseudouridine(38-40) synthase TruA [Pseudomonadota bacterium]